MKCPNCNYSVFRSGRISKSIAKEVLTYRQKHDMSQAELASRLGVSRHQIIRWEKGSCHPVTRAVAALKKEGVL